MRFLVEGGFASQPTEEMLELIPQEMAYGLQLEAQGLREVIYYAADMSRAWQVFQAESREELDKLLAGFPLTPYLAVTVTQLADVPAV